MEHWGGMLRVLLSGPRWRGGTQGWAFSSWRRHLPQAGSLSATELVNEWTAVFEKEGIPEARESSEYIVAHVLGAKTFQSLRPALRRQPLTPGQLQRIQELSGHRLQRMPVQYILGEWDFQGLSLKMAPPVFIPRPETESHQLHTEGGASPDEEEREFLDFFGVVSTPSHPLVVPQPRPAALYTASPPRPQALGHSPRLLALIRSQHWGSSQLPAPQASGMLGPGPVVASEGSPLWLAPGHLTCSSSSCGAEGLGAGKVWPSGQALRTMDLLLWGQELVEWVLEEVALRPREAEAQGGPLILEVGCGSGAISLSLLSRLPQSRAIAVDKGDAAVCLTRENAQRLRLQDRIQIVLLDVTLEGSWAHLLLWGPLDLIVSNPPYVFHQDVEQLAPEIRSYEDPAALDGGEKGMDIIEHILALAPRLLKDSGSIFLEVDPRHPELVGSWLQSRPDLSLHLVAVRRDFCGRPRFLHIRRSGAQGGCPVDV